MQIVYTGEPLPSSLTKSIFLAGPTPRSKDVKSWRPEALRILEELGYDGTVFVPEWRSGKLFDDNEKMYEWEDICLNVADCIVFWVPRDMKTMPALTTNIEWGEWMKSGKTVFGAPYDPDDQRKNKYPWHKAQKYYAPRCITLQATVEKAVELVGRGALRTGGERDEEFVWLCEQKDKKHGLHPDGGTGELTYVEVKTVREILADDIVDWSMKGMILSALNSI